MTSNAAPNRTANPWPRRPQNKLDWDIIDNLVLKRVLRSERYIRSHPPRPFPALAWVQEQEGLRNGWCAIDARPKPVLRISTEQLPVTTISAWTAEFRQNYVYTLSPWPSEREQAPAPKQRKPRRLPRVHRTLDRLILWRQSLGKKPTPAPAPAPEPEQDDESWLIA